MKGFEEFINLTAQKKCPEGYRFDKKLGVCVPIGHKGYYPYYGYRNGGNENGNENGNGNGNGNGNQNGNGINGTNGNGSNGNGGNGGNGNGS